MPIFKIEATRTMLQRGVIYVDAEDEEHVLDDEVQESIYEAFCDSQYWGDDDDVDELEVGKPYRLPLDREYSGRIPTVEKGLVFKRPRDPEDIPIPPNPNQLRLCGADEFLEKEKS